MFNVSFSEQHHTLRKESDAHTAILERALEENVHRACTMFCLAQEFEM